MFLLYPSRDFDIAITIIYVVFTQRELTVSTALVSAFSHHPRLEGGFLLVHMELPGSCKATFCPLCGHLGTYVSCPYRKALRLLPLLAVPKVHVFLHTSRVVFGQIRLAFGARVVGGESGEDGSRMAWGRLPALRFALTPLDLDLLLFMEKASGF